MLNWVKQINEKSTQEFSSVPDPAKNVAALILLGLFSEEICGRKKDLQLIIEIVLLWPPYS